MNLQDHTHKRLNILTGEWILVSPHRTKRPWQGKQEAPQQPDSLKYDPACYLCPGNERAGGAKNPQYDGVFTFTNDFSALLPDTPTDSLNVDNLLVAEGERGICKVICFSPRHDLTLARMTVDEIVPVVKTWEQEYRSLGAIDSIRYVQIFENRGAIMGCSNPHPHGQIWSNSTVPQIPAMETGRQQAYLAKHGHCLLCDYVKLELDKQERLVYRNASFAVLVPFWAVWPYEVMIVSLAHKRSLSDLDDAEQRDLADAMRITGIKFDNLFKTGFPYSMGIHQAPVDGDEHTEWHLHLHYYPPLLRSATVKKFMVGYEMMATPQRDITAEGSAATLRNLPDTHYLGADYAE